MRTSLFAIQQHQILASLRHIIVVLCVLTATKGFTQCYPVFSSSNDNTTVSCGENVPSFDACSATSECCPGPVTVTTFTSETGAIVHDCIINSAYGPGPDWAIWLPELAAPNVSWNFVGDGHLQVYEDGTGHLWGTIANGSNASMQWEVDMWFHNGKNWADWSALGRSYKNDLGFAGLNYVNWNYYELVPGFANLHGIGSLAGSHLQLNHQPANFYYGFQMGVGANNKNGNDGFSGWFTYSGTYLGQAVSGHGDVNVDQDCNDGNPSCASTEFTQICRAQDACNHLAFQSQTITVTDDVAPVVDDYDLVITMPCDSFDGVFLTATDNCSTVIITYVDEIVSPGCGGQIIRHYTVADACGNMVMVDQIINLLGEGEPEFTLFPEDIMLSCELVDGMQMPDVEWIAGCTNTQLSVEEQITPGDCPGNYIIEFIYTLTDACDNSVSQTWTITVVDNTPPQIFDVPASITIACGDNIPTAIPTVLDNCDGDVNITLDAITVQNSCGYDFIRTWTATDHCGNTSTASQTIHVSDNENPIFTFLPPSVTVNCADAFDLDLALVADQCSLVELAWTDVPLGDCAGSFLRLWRAYDGCGNQALESTEVTLIDNTPPYMTSFPEDVTVSCGEIPATDIDAIQFADNCSSVTAAFSETNEEGDCINSYTIHRTWTLTDGCGNSASYTWNIHVIDDVVPVLSGIPEDISINCGDPVSEAVVIALDNCDDEVGVSLEATTAPAECGYLFIRTWTATDACGNVASMSQTITVNDQESPTFTFVPDDVAITCGEGISLGDLDLALAEDDCSTVAVTFVDTPIGDTGTCGDGLLRTFTATDGCGNTATATQIINFSDTEAPVFTFVPGPVVLTCDGGEGNPLDQPIAEDNCSEVTITFIDEVGTTGCTGGFIRHWTATDDCGNSATVDQEISITDTEPPVITSFPVDMTVSCSDVPSIESANVTFSDDCGNVTTLFEETTDQGVCPNSYNLNRKWTFTDACGNSVDSTWTIYVVDEELPEVFGVPADTTVNCGDPIEAAVITAIDNCSSPENINVSLHAKTEELPCGYIFVRVWTVTDECGNAKEMTQEITVLDDQAPYFTFVPADITAMCGDIIELLDPVAMDDCSSLVVTTEIGMVGDCAGSYMRMFTATDGCGNTATAMQTITLVDTAAPVAQFNPETMTVNCDNIPVINADNVMFTDNCSEVTVTLQSDLLASTCPGTYDIIYTWIGQDECGNRTFIDMMMHVVDNQAPVFTETPANVTLNCGDDVPSAMNATAIDNCGVVTIETTDEFLGGSCGYQILRTYIASDDCGNSSMHVQEITFEDHDAPVFVSVLEDMNISCTDEIPEMIMPIAEDECSGATEVSVNILITTGSCPSNYTIERIFTASDFCGNESNYTQTITVSDTQAPEFLDFFLNITLSCVESNGVFVSAFDNCGSVSVIYADEFFEDECAGGLIRTYMATDACGNSSEAIQIIDMEDNEIPQFNQSTLPPAAVTMTCSEIPTPDSYAIEFTDDCSNVTISLSEEITLGSCANSYSLLRTWTISDGCGNSNFASSLITVEDNTAPVLFGVPLDMTIDCLDAIPPAPVFALDDCSSLPEITLTATTEAIGCTTYFTRRWTAIDECGNVSQEVQVITISDLHAPVLSEYPADMELDCTDEAPVAPIITVSDNCDNDVVVVFTELVGGGSPDCPTITRTWCATDCTGNEECHEQTITFVTPEAMATNNASLYAWQASASDVNIRTRANSNSRWNIEVFDITGRHVETIYSGDMKMDEERQFVLDITHLKDAVYLIRFTNGEERLTKSLAIIR